MNDHLSLDPVAIEQEIQKQVSAVSATAARASLFTLVIFKQAFAPGPADGALNFLLGKRPGRIILVESGFEGESRAHVSARCDPRLKKAEVCFQEIHIQNGRDDIGRDPAFWGPLIIRELPAFLWWLEPILPFPELLHQAEEVADRFLVDGSFQERLNVPPARLYRELAARWEYGVTTAYADFAWASILPLRKAAARLFEPEGERENLELIEGVRLEAGGRAEGLLFFFWLASRLGWEPAGREENRIRARNGRKGEVTFSHAPGPSLDHGYRLEFVLRGGRRYLLTCGENGLTCLSRPEAQSQPLRFRVPAAGEILLKELDTPRPDPLFYEALQAAREGLDQAMVPPPSSRSPS